MNDCASTERIAASVQDFHVVDARPAQGEVGNGEGRIGLARQRFALEVPLIAERSSATAAGIQDQSRAAHDGLIGGLADYGGRSSGRIP